MRRQFRRGLLLGLGVGGLALVVFALVVLLVLSAFFFGMLDALIQAIVSLWH